MKTSELAKEVGIDKLHAGRLRRKVSPENKGGPLAEWEIKAIKDALGVITGATRKKVQGIFGDAKYPNFVECSDDGERITVQIPHNYEPEMFIGRWIWVQQREYAPGRFVYHYNPYKQDD